MRESLTSLRRLWTIIILLDGEKRNQKEIVGYLKEIDNEIKEKKDYRDLKYLNANKSTQSLIMNYLEKKRIIEINPEDYKKEIKPGVFKDTNLKANMCSILDDFDTFLKIIFEIIESNINENRKNFFTLYLLNSDYASKYLDGNFIPRLQKEKKLPIWKLDKYEEEKITLILRTSPRAFIYTVTAINNRESYLKEDSEKFVDMILINFNLDLIDPLINIKNSRYLKWIYFEKNIKFPEYMEEGKKDKPVDIKADKNSLKSEIIEGSKYDHAISHKNQLFGLIPCYVKSYPRGLQKIDRKKDSI